MRRLIVLPLVMAAACSMNPRLDTPSAPVDAVFPQASSDEAPGAAATDWREMFGDARLQRLIELALANNRDLRITTLNVEAARSQFRVQRASRLPSIDVNGSYTRQRTPLETAAAGLGGGSPSAPQVGPVVGPVVGADRPSGIEFGQFNAGAALTSFEIDLFGRLRSQSQAAFERYLASDEGRRAARIALMGSVVDAYLAERLAEEQRILTERTLVDWRTSLDIAQRLRRARQNSGLDVAQAEGLVRQAEADLALRTRALQQARNLLRLLVGAPIPTDLPPAVPIMAQPVVTTLSAGLPSDLIANRPDIRQSEHELIAANADVGAARAAFFPRVSITGLLGFTSLAFDGLFKGDNRTWSFSPQISQPIFRGGGLRGQLALSQVRKSAAIAQYERTIQVAFREVADGLAGRETYARQAAAQRSVVEAAARRVALSDLRYRAGVDGRLELLDAQRSDYAARQVQLDLRREELSNAAALYRSLGGGDADGGDR